MHNEKMILLDLDDTLVDHTTARRKASELFGCQMAASIPDYQADRFADRWNQVAELHIAAFLRGEIDFQTQRRRRMREILGQADMPDAQADEVFSRYLKHYENSWRALPDVAPFLEAMKDQPMGILSDGAQAQQEKKLRRVGIDHYFQFVMTAESIGAAKPDPEMFRAACRRAGVRPDQACYIGDNLQKDALGAARAGLRGVWLNRAGREVPPGVEAIASLDQFRL
jgi:putative hydrolase of the HAD superfamily